MPQETRLWLTHLPAEDTEAWGGGVGPGPPGPPLGSVVKSTPMAQGGAQERFPGSAERQEGRRGWPRLPGGGCLMTPAQLDDITLLFKYANPGKNYAQPLAARGLGQEDI